MDKELQGFGQNPTNKDVAGGTELGDESASAQLESSPPAATYFMNGWIKLHRKFLDWEWFKDSNMVHLFLHLLLSANHEPRKWKGVDILPGQIVTGRHSLSDDTGISERSIRTCLTRLKSTSELTIKSTNKYSIITITKWSSYQKAPEASDQLNDQLSANKRPATDHKQEVKKEKKKRNVFVQPTIEEVTAYCKKRGNNIDPKAWMDHYLSNGWKVGKALAPMQDWQAAIRTWENYGIPRSVKRESLWASEVDLDNN
jgi:hypothetical protein